MNVEGRKSKLTGKSPGKGVITRKQMRSQDHIANEPLPKQKSKQQPKDKKCNLDPKKDFELNGKGKISKTKSKSAKKLVFDQNDDRTTLKTVEKSLINMNAVDRLDESEDLNYGDGIDIIVDTHEFDSYDEDDGSENENSDV